MKGAPEYILYGITSCNTVRKAREWLAQHGIAVGFHDFKKSGLDQATARKWPQQLDWTKLINRNGLTWRGLPDQRKEKIHDSASALALMLEKKIQRHQAARAGTKRQAAACRF